MGVRITIDEVPEQVRDELAARAASQGSSLEDYLRRHFERLTEHPPAERLLAAIRQRKAAAGARISVVEILAARDTDRR